MFQDFDWIQAMRTSPVMVIILACSVISMAFALERLIYFWKRRDRVETVTKAALERVHDGDLRGAMRECARSRHPFGAVGVAVLENAHQRGAVAEETLQIALAEQRLLLERNLGVLGTMGNVAPLIGLLGTVWGIMRAFNDMARTGSAGPSVVAAGVAEALFTTASGLLVAVPAVLLFNHFTRRMSVKLTVAENQARRLRQAVESAFPEPTPSPAPESPRAVVEKSAPVGLEVLVRP
jgi:biopolymer transport protein ExbB